MSDFNIIETVSEPEKPTKVTGRKRKHEIQEDLTELRAIAKSFCSCPEQWKSVSRYKNQRLQEFVDTKQFERDQAMRETVFSSLHKLYAFGLDFFSRGGGFVKEQVENDLSLRDALEQECSSLLKYLTNKSKIAFLTSTDVLQGKVIQKQSEPVIQYVDNEDNEASEILVGEDAPSDSLEAEPVAEEGVKAEEDTERLDVEGLDC
jgi:hypothetical protein